VVYTYLSRREFLEADLEGTQDAPALPRPRGVLEPAE
jgi:hypothetical protein